MLTFSTHTLSEQLRQMPMAAIFLSLVIGIFASQFLAWHYGVWSVAMAVAVVLLLFSRYSIFLLFICLGGFAKSVNAPKPLHFSHPVRYVVKIDKEAVSRGSYHTTTAHLLSADGKRCSGKVQVATDSLLTPHCGDIIGAKAYLRAFSESGSGYEKSMLRRGYIGNINISQSRVFTYLPTAKESLHRTTHNRLASLIPDGAGKKVALAMTLGSKEYFEGSLRQSYSNVGVSHLLAVSGLHVGIVVMLLNLLFLPLVLLWRGNTIKSVAIVAAIWVYVALCGYPVSAIRAAIMFSVLQLSLGTRGVHSAANSLFAAAFIMVALEPATLFDISFTLSFSAVAGIIFVGKPLCNMLRGKSPVLNAVTDSLVISVVCTLATMPIISETFGVVSLLSVAVNPIVIFIAQIVIMLSFATLCLPQSVAQYTGAAAEWCGSVQNSVVSFADSVGIGYVSTQSTPAITLTLYAFFALMIVLSLGCQRDY